MNLLLVFIFSLINSFGLSYGYDPLDPYANITVRWDFLQQSGSSSDIKVSIYNFQQFRHVDRPGWKLGWTWKGDEVIWDMWGAEATEQGNCSKFKGSPDLPHCCKKKPVIIDLLPGAPFNKQYFNCCKGGELSSMIQDSSKFGSSFAMSVGSFAGKDIVMPTNFTLGLPGYTCGMPFQVQPTKFSHDGRRWKQVLETWNVTCIYSLIRASPSPKCCVSLSAFYSSTIVPCPKCSCGCQGLPGVKCVSRPGEESPPLLQLPHAHETEEPSPLVTCSRHMCPIRVHWHVKQSYEEYWRVKITITNYNFVKNYSYWTLVVQHPNLQSLTQLFSFNYHPLNQYGTINDTGMFWGIKYYNDLLLTTGKNGVVQTEMLLHKDAGTFTFREGWTFPRKISFNGDECVMPPPDEYPRLPNAAPSATASKLSIVAFISLGILVAVF
ncbi:COBRA-like protein 6 isoform X1 [Pyrus x bretschneideri]|uniref:COBRA-like protein 6 isoform X1 n=1 Tax=Pyrus x bretschneideri TaxID=225117 RepID=UPI00202DBFEB|nr:COBRA-like protein 6 isoform X1 [Pyrus x bretschneideri]